MNQVCKLCIYSDDSTQQ